MADLIPIELLPVILTGITGVAIAIINKRSTRDVRAKIVTDLDILEKLPENSSSRTALVDSIESRVLEISGAGEESRDRFGMALAVVFLVLGLVLIPVVNSLGGFWLLLHAFTGFLLLFGVAGLFISGRKTKRDEKGKAVKEAD